MIFLVLGVLFLFIQYWLTAPVLLLTGTYILPKTNQILPTQFKQKSLPVILLVLFFVGIIFDGSTQRKRAVEDLAKEQALEQKKVAKAAADKEKAEIEAQINFYHKNIDNVFKQLEERTIEHAYAYTSMYEPLIKDQRLTQYHNKLQPKYLAIMEQKAKKEREEQELKQGIFTKENFTAGDWPYSIDKVKIGCFVNGTFIESGVNKYALNGIAKNKKFGYLSLSEIKNHDVDDQFIRDAALATCDAEKEARKKYIEEKQLSAWDGSHTKLERLLKENLNDPDSYEHAKTYYYPDSYPLRIRLEYRAKNGFGAMTLGFVLAEVTEDGDVKSVVDEG